MVPDDTSSLHEGLKAAFFAPHTSVRSQIPQQVLCTLSDLQASLFDSQRKVIAAALRSINEPRQVFAEHGYAAGILPLNGIVQYPPGAIESLVLAWVTRLLESLVGQQTPYVLKFIRGCHFARPRRPPQPFESMTMSDFDRPLVMILDPHHDPSLRAAKRDCVKLCNPAQNREEDRQHAQHEWEELRAKGVLKGLTIPDVWSTLGSGGLFTAVKRDEPGRNVLYEAGFGKGYAYP
jgi:hypothetical protein